MIGISYSHSRGCADDWMAGGSGRSYPRGPGQAINHYFCLCTSTAMMSSSTLLCSSILVPPGQSNVVSMGSGISLPTKLECHPLPFLPSLSRNIGTCYFRPRCFLGKELPTYSPPSSNPKCLQKGFYFRTPPWPLFNDIKEFSLFKVTNCTSVISFAGKKNPSKYASLFFGRASYYIYLWHLTHILGTLQCVDSFGWSWGERDESSILPWPGGVPSLISKKYT